jgi:hypothetical protein
VYPVEQLQEFGALQVPLEVQTFEFEEFNPKQRFKSHLLPTYPVEHLQFPGDKQTP